MWFGLLIAHEQREARGDGPLHRESYGSPRRGTGTWLECDPPGGREPAFASFSANVARAHKLPLRRRRAQGHLRESR